jgi:hypothetical protein
MFKNHMGINPSEGPPQEMDLGKEPQITLNQDVQGPLNQGIAEDHGKKIPKGEERVESS